MGEKIWTPSEMGRKGGKKSAETRLGGKTPTEKSALMRQVRLSKADKKDLQEFAEASVKSLNKSATK